MLPEPVPLYVMMTLPRPSAKETRSTVRGPPSCEYGASASSTCCEQLSSRGYKPCAGLFCRLSDSAISLVSKGTYRLASSLRPDRTDLAFFGAIALNMLRPSPW
eukprot:scaffold16599_cov60-Phaeocystis_antarctica.AAC.2